MLGVPSREPLWMNKCQVLGTVRWPWHLPLVNPWWISVAAQPDSLSTEPASFRAAIVPIHVNRPLAWHSWTDTTTSFSSLLVESTEKAWAFTIWHQHCTPKLARRRSWRGRTVGFSCWQLNPEGRVFSILFLGCALLNSPNKAFTQDQVQDLAAHPAPALLLGLLAVLSTATMRAIRKCSLFAVFRVPHISLVRPAFL